MPVPTLRRFPPPLRLDLAPLARIDASGRLHDLDPAFLPHAGPGLVVCWRPGETPAFTLHAATLLRGSGGGALLPPPGEGWVVLWTRPPGS